MANCTRYGFKLNKPCSLCKCKYHIDSEEHNNCLSQYVLTEGHEPLKINEIAVFLDVKKADVVNSLNEAVDEIKISKLEKTVDVGNEIDYVENSHRCVCCSKKADIPVGPRSPNLYYCSKTCSKILPPKLVYLVQRLGVDARTILVACVRSLSGQSILELLEVTEQELKFLFKYYFGITLSKITNENVELDLEYLEPTYHYYKLPNLKSFIYNDEELVKNNVISCFC